MDLERINFILDVLNVPNRVLFITFISLLEIAVGLGVIGTVLYITKQTDKKIFFEELIYKVILIDVWVCGMLFLIKYV